MTTEMPERERDATESVVYHIDNNHTLERLIHDMLHACKTIENFTERLDGLLKVFWGATTPDNKPIEEVNWIDVIVQILPTECLLPVFKNSMLTLEKEIRNEEPENPIN